MFNWTVQVNSANVNYVLWGRGTGNAAVMEYLADPTCPICIKCAVFDSPFTSLKEVVKMYLNKLSEKSYFTPYMFYNLWGEYIRNKVIQKVGKDPYTITPIEFAIDIHVPCAIICAENDDYIPISQCEAVKEALPVPGPPIRTFPGSKKGNLGKSRIICINSIRFVYFILFL